MNEVAEPIKPTKIMMKMVVVAALIIIAIGAIYYRSLVIIPFALGVCITSALNILKLRMLERTVQKVIAMDDQDAGKLAVRFQYLLRYFLTGAVLVAIGLIQNYTSPPPIWSNRDWYIGVWSTLFPNAPEYFKHAPFISVWGALAGIFTLQLSIIIVRSMKLEKDGTNFIKYEDDEDENDIAKDDEADAESSAATDNEDDNVNP